MTSWTNSTTTYYRSMKKKPDPTIKLKATIAALKQSLKETKEELDQTKRHANNEKLRADDLDKTETEYWNMSKDLLTYKYDGEKVNNLTESRDQASRVRVHLAEQQEDLLLKRAQARRRILMFDLNASDFFNIQISQSK